MAVYDGPDFSHIEHICRYRKSTANADFCCFVLCCSFIVVVVLAADFAPDRICSWRAYGTNAGCDAVASVEMRRGF